MTLLTTLARWFLPSPPPAPEVEAGLARICELVDPALKGLPDLERRLAEPVAQALSYCERMIATMPGALPVDRTAFAADPLVHALFATADDITQLLGSSQTVRDYLSEPGGSASDEIHAMLAARRFVKKTLGVAMEGEVLQNDVPIQYLYFSDHLIAIPAPDPAAHHVLLRQRAFDSLLKSFHAHLRRLREERQSLRDERAVESDQVSLLRALAQETELEAHTRRLDDLDQRLRASADALRPEHIASALAAFLSAPESALRLEPLCITVDRAGVISDQCPIDRPGIDSINFQQIVARDRRRYIVRCVKFNRADALAAVEAVKEVQSRYLII